MAKQLYKVLGAKEDSTTSEIKKAFRSKSKQHHPDKGGNPDEFQKLKEAYDVLSDPEKRKYYDETGISPLETNKNNDILKHLNSYINAVLTKQGITAENLVKNLKSAIENDDSKLTQAKNKTESHMESLKRIVKKKCSGQDRPSLKNISEEIIQGLTADIQKIDYALEINKACLEKIETYKDDFDELIHYSRQPFFSTTTTGMW